MPETHSPTSAATALQPLALLAIGRTGADVERIVREVRQKARRERRDLTWADIEQALGAQQMVMSDDLRWRVSLHEAGHAMAWTLLEIGEVEAITLGLQEVGQVTVRRYTHLAQSEAWLTKTMAAILAGRVAETLVIGEVLAGSGAGPDSDLAKATAIALDAETCLGFADHQPLLYRASVRGLDVLTLDHELAERVNARLIAAETMAHDVLQAQRVKLLQIATRLNTVGVMSGEEVRQLLGGNEA
ncbi:ATP-dependent metallopeptidase FtsH/Yme1/Tma family protein [Hoeflea alexandrii]|uniref:ATP-dependent Zn protease n=1 Tax=Hoeflea alexandrii TaxID=288436 RepID=UPI00226E0631|nr:ATP-dependent Zn protease [Hoeflea alexandrii]MCY0154990.1 ATP-dependent Zn protease [Hoeflea alexandrii]